MITYKKHFLRPLVQGFGIVLRLKFDKIKNSVIISILYVTYWSTNICQIISVLAKLLLDMSYKSFSNHNRNAKQHA